MNGTPVFRAILTQISKHNPRRRLYCTRVSRELKSEDTTMAKGQMRSNREKKKPKKEVPKPTAAAPSSIGAGFAKGAKGGKPKG
jgi:hypothetical protein